MASSAENWQRLVRAALERDRVVDLVSAVLPSLGSTTSIEHLLQAAEDIEDDDPNMARILCEQAYTMAQDLDPSSAGSGVLQFKTALASVIQQKRARKKDGESIYRGNDMEDLWNFYLEYKSRCQFAEIQGERERMRESATFCTEMGARAAEEMKSIYATLWALLDALAILVGQAPTHWLARQIRQKFSEMELEEHDEYLRVVSKTFRTEDEGYQFYNEYAEFKGFSVRNRKERASTHFTRLYTCFKEGHGSLANFKRPDPKRTLKALTRCGCRAHLEIELNATTGEWFVKKFQDEHNHQLAKVSDDPLLKSAARIYTPEMFKMVKEQLVKSAGWEIGEMIQEDETSVNFLVSSEWDEHEVRCVFVQASLESVSCDCRKMEHEEIPCAHVFCVLKHYNMRDIPPCCVAVRWTMEAKNAFEPDRIGSTHVWSEQMDRFHELRNMCDTAMFKVSMSAEKSERVKALLKSIIDEDAENEENADIVSSLYKY